MSFTYSSYVSGTAGISNIITTGGVSFNPKAVAVNGNYIFILNNSIYNSLYTVIYSTDAGSTWNRPTSSTIGNTVLSISVSQNGYVLVCGYSGVYYSNNAGQTFTNLNPPSTVTTIGAISNDGSTLYVANCGGNSSKNFVWRSNTSNPNSWSTAFGNNLALYNANNDYKDSTTPELACCVATNEDGSYLFGTTYHQLFLGISNTFVNPTPVGAGTAFYGLAVSNNGKVLACTNSYNGLWVSTNGGTSFKNTLSGTSNLQLVEVEKTQGKVIFTCSTNTNTIYYSINSGNTWKQFYLPGGYAISDIRYNLSTSTFYVVLPNNGTVLAYNLAFGTPPTIVINGTTVAVNGTYTAIARTSSVTVTATTTDLRTVSSITGTTQLIDDLNTVTITMEDGQVYLVYVMVLRNCFKEGTNILCYVDNEEKYLPVQELRKGTLVKTEVNGYVAIHAIGQTKIYNSDNKLRHLNRLFRCTKEKYPELTEDLIITGCHGILVDDDRITDEVKRKTKEITRDDVWLTGKKYRLLTCLDERAEPYEEEGTFPIWHFALDHFDKYMNYGIYANGLLVETCDIYNIEEHSGLELI
jgi:hypothetical protein